MAELKPLLRMNPGELFVESRLSGIENAIKLAYLKKGFVQVALSSQTNEAGRGLAKPVIVVKENSPVSIGQVKIVGNQAIPSDDLLKKVTIKQGDPYYVPSILDSRDQLRDEYLNKGYESVDVKSSPFNAVSAAQGTATSEVTYTVVEGPQTIVEHIFVSGNIRTRPEVVLRQLKIKEGMPLGAEGVDREPPAAQRARHLQAGADLHDFPRRSLEERRRHHRRRSAADDDRLRRRTAGRPDPAIECRPDGERTVRIRAARILRDRAAISAGRDRSPRPLHRLSVRPTTTSTDMSQFPEYRVVLTYREPQAFRRPRGSHRDRGGGAGRADGLQL